MLVLVLASVPVAVGMSGNHDPNVLPGPKTPYWGCSKCGVDRNYACRIKCRCGARAPTRVEQAAKREAAAARLQPTDLGNARPRGKWTHGPPKPDSEVAKLRAEVAKLREAAKNGGAEVQGEEIEVVEDEEPTIDLQKARATYDAIVAAFGANSKRA